jgi:putative nucleotidyltransferase with HDIG domain
MKSRGHDVSLLDMVLTVSKAVDLVCPALVDHHTRVAVLALALGRESAFPESRLKELTLAGALHDVGGLATRERIDLLHFETVDTESHCKLGAVLLEAYPPFERIAAIVRHHHDRWDSGRGADSAEQPVSAESRLLHVADRVAVLMEPGRDILGQAPAILHRVRKERGRMFEPAAVDVLMAAASREGFWLDAVDPGLDRRLHQDLEWERFDPDSVQLKDLARFFRRLIDYRSPYTATHSAGVSHTASCLAGKSGFAPADCERMELAGNLHDLGKLAVPLEILEKPGPLTQGEVEVMRSHAYHTHRLLESIPALDTVCQWGALHHEKLDGSGYPFHLHADQIPLGSRMMAVSDVFTALAEDRPYRPGLPMNRVVSILDGLVAGGGLDASVVDLVRRNADEVLAGQREIQKTSVIEYATLRAQAVLN